MAPKSPRALTPADFGIGILFDIVHDGIIVVEGSTGRVVLCNAAVAGALGFPPNEARGRDLSEFIPGGLATVAALSAGASDLEGTREPIGVQAVHREGRPMRLQAVRLLSVQARGKAGVYHLVLFRANPRFRQRDALLRLSREFSSEAHPVELMRNLVQGASDAVGGDQGVVFLWNEAEQVLVPVVNTLTNAAEFGPVKPGDGVSGRCVAARAPVIENDYQTAHQVLGPAIQAGITAALGVPLIHEGRVLGALVVHTKDPDKKFTRSDAEMVELIAGMASAALVGMERSRLEGVLLAVRTTEHELNNQLALAVGYAELLSTATDLPPRLRTLALEAVEGAQSAATTLERLQQLTIVEEKSWGALAAPTIDIQRSRR